MSIEHDTGTAIKPALRKPSRVEKGQRWRNQGKEYVVESFGDGIANLGGLLRASIESMLKYDSFEYLGMTESTKPVEASNHNTIVTLSDSQRRWLSQMLLEQRVQSDEEPSESLQGIASKAKLGGTLDLLERWHRSANECATVLDTMPAFKVDHWIEVADLLKALKSGRET